MAVFEGLEHILLYGVVARHRALSKKTLLDKLKSVQRLAAIAITKVVNSSQSH